MEIWEDHPRSERSASAVLERIAELDGMDEPKRPDEITAREYARRFGIGHNTAMRRLRDLEARGLLVRRETIVDGKRAYVFREAPVVEETRDADEG